jgi:outer membrane protein
MKNEQTAAIVLAVCLILALPASAAAFGVEIAGGAWLQAPSGHMAYKPLGSFSDLDLEDDLDYDDKIRPFGRLKIDMPLFVPNLYIMATPIKFDGRGSKNVSFNFGDLVVPANTKFDSELTLNHLDVALYYSIPLLETASLNTVSIDLGLNVRVADLKGQIKVPSLGRESEDYLLPVPMVFAAVQLRPFDFLAIEAEGRGITFKGDKVYSLIGRVRWNLFGPLFLTGGYRYDKIDVDKDDLDINADFSGPFAEAGLSF